MESTICFSSAPLPTFFKSSIDQKPRFQLNGQRESTRKAHAISSTSSLSRLSSNWGRTGSVGDMQICRSSYPSSFCYDKPIPEEIIEKPVALSEISIGSNPRCSGCEAKGAVPCATCASSGLYIDSIMESQGIIVKVRCLGCGGSGNIMCSHCGGRGHL